MECSRCVVIEGYGLPVVKALLLGYVLGLFVGFWLYYACIDSDKGGVDGEE